MSNHVYSRILTCTHVYPRVLTCTHTKSIISSKLDTILNILNEHSLSIEILKSKLTETNTQQNDTLSYAIPVYNSSTSNIHQPYKKINNKLTATQLNYNITDYNPNAIVIENVKSDQRNKKYLTELINNLKIDSNNTYNVTINKNNTFF